MANGVGKPFISYAELVQLIRISDLNGLDRIQGLLILEEKDCTYTRKEMDALWCVLIDRFDKLERWLGNMCLN